MRKHSPDDILDAARTVWAESRSEPFDGQVAVAHVILTRAKRARDFRERTGRDHPLYGDGTLASAVRRPWQFSPWNRSDPQRERMVALEWKHIEQPHFRCAVLAVLGAIEGTFTDPSMGATHFFADWIEPPSWADQRKKVCTIGHHAFYNLEDG